MDKRWSESFSSGGTKNLTLYDIDLMKCQGHWPALPERYECEDENWEEHFEIGVGSEAKCTQHQQLHHLENGEQVDRPLGDPTYVVVWWVGTLKANQFFFHVFWWRSHFFNEKVSGSMLKISDDNVALSINILLIRIFKNVYKLIILVNFNWFRFWFQIKVEDLLFR